MGSSKSKFQDNNWEFAHNTNHQYDIYQNQHGQLAEKHIVQNNTHISNSDEMEIYHYRNSTDKPIVKVHNAEFEKADSFCGVEKNIEVFSEYIPYRLSDLRNLNYGQGLYVLNESLVGFHQLFQKVGPFMIDDNNIGFNEQGNTKVWMNKNFAKNHLDKDEIILMSTKNPKNFDRLMVEKQEEDMVLDIWNAVYEHSDPNCYPAAFKEYTNNFEQMGFLEARQKVKDAIEDQDTYVPQKLNFHSKFLKFGSNIGDSNHMRLQNSGQQSSGHH